MRHNRIRAPLAWGVFQFGLGVPAQGGEPESPVVSATSVARILRLPPAFSRPMGLGLPRWGYCGRAHARARAPAAHESVHTDDGRPVVAGPPYDVERTPATPSQSRTGSAHIESNRTAICPRAGTEALPSRPEIGPKLAPTRPQANTTSIASRPHTRPRTGRSSTPIRTTVRPTLRPSDRGRQAEQPHRPTDRGQIGPNRGQSRRGSLRIPSHPDSAKSGAASAKFAAKPTELGPNSAKLGRSGASAGSKSHQSRWFCGRVWPTDAWT